MQKTSEALKQFSTDLRNLNEQLELISSTASKQRGNIEYAYLRNQFDVYKRNIGELKEIFLSQNKSTNSDSLSN
jgi:hypothetical protein